MMELEAFPPALYNYLKFANESKMEKTILDCGAGGSFPKLTLFHYFGFKTYGIELLQERIDMANDYCQKYNIKLKIKKADMRNIPFDSNSFGFTYSYNTIFHLNKVDTQITLDEMFRVLKRKGLLYINLLSLEDSTYGKGEEIRPGECLSQIEGDEEVLHCYYGDDEGDTFFKNHKIIYKEKRRVFINKIDYLPCYLDYIVKKRT